ncbi:MAG: hypothetical protein MI923_12130 [Phycisphaerales bacterium]|nr:hypothetical protein [Phycisphaerales bacterium]
MDPIGTQARVLRSGEVRGGSNCPNQGNPEWQKRRFPISFLIVILFPLDSLFSTGVRAVVLDGSPDPMLKSRLSPPIARWI